VKRFVGQKRKCESFLGIFGNAQPGRGQDFDPGKRSGKLGKDQRIVRATAGNNQLVDLRLAQNETI